MKRNYRRLQVSIAAVTLCLAAAGQSTAQEYPTKPIRIIAQFAPGSSTDTTARIIAQRLSEDWGQQVIVDNRPGAGGVVGTEIGARAVSRLVPRMIELTASSLAGFPEPE